MAEAKGGGGAGGAAQTPGGSATPNPWGLVARIKSSGWGAAAFQVDSVRTGSPAEAAGLKEGSYLVALDGHIITRGDVLTKELAKGGKHSLGYVSAVSVEQREIELVRRTSNEPLGLRLCQAEGCTGGVVVESVLEGSVAARCGVPVGMVVRTIQSKIAGKLGKVKTAGKLDHAKAAAAVGDVVKLAGNVITFELAHKKVSLGNGGDKAFGAAYHYVDGKEFHRLLGCTIIQVKQQIVAMRPTEVKDDGRCRDQDDAAPSARSLARSSVAALDRSPRSGTKAGGILRLLLGAMGAGVASVAALNWHRNYDKRIEKAATAA